MFVIILLQKYLSILQSPRNGTQIKNLFRTSPEPETQVLSAQIGALVDQKVYGPNLTTPFAFILDRLL